MGTPMIYKIHISKLYCLLKKPKKSMPFIVNRLLAASQPADDSHEMAIPIFLIINIDVTQ